MDHQTIKTLSNGKALTSTGHDLYLDGAWVGGASAVRLLSAPQNGMSHYLPLDRGGIGLTKAEAGMVEALRQTVERDAAKSRAEGGEGYNPIRHADPYATDSREPQHKED